MSATENISIAENLKDVERRICEACARSGRRREDVTLIAEETGTGADGMIRYRFIIRDTGLGISEEYLPHIFDSFTREQRTTINRVQGTGLGLAITAKVVELMGGTINVKSKLGEGSEFTVELELESLDEPDFFTRSLLT